MSSFDCTCTHCQVNMSESIGFTYRDRTLSMPVTGQTTRFITILSLRMQSPLLSVKLLIYLWKHLASTAVLSGVGGRMESPSGGIKENIWLPTELVNPFCLCHHVSFNSLHHSTLALVISSPSVDFIELF